MTFLYNPGCPCGCPCLGSGNLYVTDCGPGPASGVDIWAYQDGQLIGSGSNVSMWPFGIDIPSGDPVGIVVEGGQNGAIASGVFNIVKCSKTNEFQLGFDGLYTVSGRAYSNTTNCRTLFPWDYRVTITRVANGQVLTTIDVSPGETWKYSFLAPRNLLQAYSIRVTYSQNASPRYKPSFNPAQYLAIGCTSNVAPEISWPPADGYEATGCDHPIKVPLQATNAKGSFAFDLIGPPGYQYGGVQSFDILGTNCRNGFAGSPGDFTSCQNEQMVTAQLKWAISVSHEPPPSQNCSPYVSWTVYDGWVCACIGCVNPPLVLKPTTPGCGVGLSDAGAFDTSCPVFNVVLPAPDFGGLGDVFGVGPTIVTESP